MRGSPRPLVWRWYSSLISVKTATSGDGRNWSAAAEISDSRPDLRKARRNRADCLRADEKLRNFAIMIVHEKTDATASSTSTA